MRPDDLFLREILEAAHDIDDFLEGVDRAEFLDSNLVRSAVHSRLLVIGEAAARVSAFLKGGHPEIPWAAVVAFRNVLIHEYFAIDWALVWDTATSEVPDLITKVAAILDPT